MPYLFSKTVEKRPFPEITFLLATGSEYKKLIVQEVGKLFLIKIAKLLVHHEAKLVKLQKSRSVNINLNKIYISNK